MIFFTSVAASQDCFHPKTLLIRYTYPYMHSANSQNQSNLCRPMGYFLWGDGHISFTSDIPLSKEQEF